MKRRRGIIILAICAGLFFIIFFGRTNHIPEEDFELVPYSGSEVLIFESNQGDVDTIFLQGTSQHTSPTDPLDIFPVRAQHFSIIARHSDPSPPGGNHRYLEGKELVGLSMSESNETWIKIRFAAKDAWFYGDASLRTSQFHIRPEIRIVIEDQPYDDVVVFEDTEKEYYQRSNHVERLYWSKTFGVVKYDKKEGETWELREIIKAS
jgi:hypothetical protein